MMSLSITYMDTLVDRIVRLLSSRLPLRIKVALLLKLYPEWPPLAILRLFWRPVFITRLNIKLNMSEALPAREALKGMEIAVPPGHDLPPQQSPDPYAQRLLPPIPPKSPARGPVLAKASSHQEDVSPCAPPRSPARGTSVV